jgi:hypothetical protein
MPLELVNAVDLSEGADERMHFDSTWNLDGLECDEAANTTD